MEKRFPNAQAGEKSITMQPEIYYGTQVNVLDTEKDSLLSLMGMRYINKLLYLKEKTPKINWSIKDSTKNIGNYNVQKATATFRGRDYTAWFTPEIPVPFGPWKLHGLPGLILQAYDSSGSIYFSATNISLNSINTMEPISLDDSDQTVTLAEYKDIMNNYERYQKQSLLKQIRPFVSDEDFANMNVHLQPIKHMERFDEDEQ
jgi:GLPGLI family protein